MYTADWVHQTLSVIDLDPILERPTWLRDINTTFATNAALPTRLVLLRLPLVTP